MFTDAAYGISDYNSGAEYVATSDSFEAGEPVFNEYGDEPKA